jgi:hypothetical protein
MTRGELEESGPMSLGRRTAEGGCPYMAAMLLHGAWYLRSVEKS